MRGRGGVPGSALACRTNWPPGSAAIGGRGRGLDAELIRRAGLSLADAFDLWRVEELVAAAPGSGSVRRTGAVV